MILYLNCIKLQKEIILDGLSVMTKQRVHVLQKSMVMITGMVIESMGMGDIATMEDGD